MFQPDVVLSFRQFGPVCVYDEWKVSKFRRIPVKSSKIFSDLKCEINSIKATNLLVEEDVFWCRDQPLCPSKNMRDFHVMIIDYVGQVISWESILFPDDRVTFVYHRRAINRAIDQVNRNFIQ